MHKDLEDDLYVQFMANLFSALTTAVLIGSYHIIVHLWGEKMICRSCKTNDVVGEDELCLDCMRLSYGV